MNKQIPQVLKNISVLLVTLLVCLAVAELVCRAARVIARSRDVSIPILQASDDPLLGISLRPSTTGETLGKAVTTNEDGFRDPSWNDGALADGTTERIVIVGDSIAFGYGVGQDEAFPRLVERGLRAAGKAVRVYNLSVPGYGLTQELELLKRYLPRLHPQRVIIAYCLNDPDPAGVSTEAFHILQPPLLETWYIVSRLWDFVRFKRSGLDYHEYVHARGAEALSAYFSTLGELRKAGVDISVLIVPVFLWEGGSYPYVDIHSTLRAKGAAAGVPVLDIVQPLMATPAESLRLDLWHPTAEGHRRIADELLRHLLSTATGVLPTESEQAK